MKDQGEGQGRASGGERALAEPAPEDRVEHLEGQLRELRDALAAMDARLRGLEGRSPIEPEAPPVSAVHERPEPDKEAAPAFEPGPSFGDVLPQVAAIGGRTLLILGGGYLLRDLTERGVLSAGMGALVGLAYAAIWLGLAHYQAREAPSASASFYAVAFALTAFPLIGEMTARFDVLAPVGSALAYAGAAGAGVFVAWRRRLAVAAWSILALVVFTAGGAVLQLKQPLPYLLMLVALGVALDASAASRGWGVLRIAAAAVVNLGFFVFGLVQLLAESYSWRATLVVLSLFAATMLFFSLRAQLEKRSLSGFERLQAAAVLLVGFLGAVALVRQGPAPHLTLFGLVSLGIGAAAYTVAYFLFVVPGRNRVEAWFNTSYALVGILVGSWLVLPEPGYAWAGIGVLFAVLGIRDKHAALPLHSAVCAFAAALGSGLLAGTFDAFWASPRAPWSALDPPTWAALLVGVIAYLVPVESERARALLSSRAAKTLALSVTVAGLGSVAVLALSGPVGGGLGQSADAGRMAALRTGILAASAVGLSALSRLRDFREAGYLVYPLLGAGALKLVLQDFPNGRALTLFVALALFGVASIVAPRLRYRPGI